MRRSRDASHTASTAGADAAGNIYSATFGSGKKISGSGTVTTFATPTLDTPRGMAFDAVGNFYVAANGTRRVRKYNSAGVFQFEWDMGGPRSQHLLMQPGAIPAPGAIALLGAAGLMGSRRRR